MFCFCFVREIRELFDSPSRLDISPISGYLHFPEGESKGEILIQSKDDDEEEANEVFAVKMVATTGARIHEDRGAAILTGARFVMNRY